jgi:tetratricopeptide (TPR) repeat protein
MRTLVLTLVLVTAASAGSRAAQDALERAKSEYASAAYDDALATLTGIEAGTPVDVVEAEQYRAFCLIALGRTEEAERAIGVLLQANPRYVPSETVASPSVLSLVSEMRRKQLPEVARRLLEEGRTAYTRKEFEKAQGQLGLLLEILDEEGMRAQEGSEDLRLIASGFIGLMEAAAALPARRADSSPGVPVTGSTRSPAAGIPAPGVPPEEDSSPAVQQSSLGTARDALEPPVTVEQTVPVWVPPDGVAGANAYRGAVKVRIGTDGRVKTATIERPSHPMYDVRLLQAAKGWLYRPAMRNGEPVESEKIVAVQLNPRK